jgi:hypothetical protein
MSEKSTVSVAEAFDILMKWITDPFASCQGGCEECVLRKSLFYKFSKVCPISDVLPSAIHAFFGECNEIPILIKRFREAVKEKQESQGKDLDTFIDNVCGD